MTLPRVGRWRQGAAWALVAATLAAGGTARAQSGAHGNAPPAASAPAGLAPGETVPAFDAERVDGGMTHVGYPTGKTTVLLFFLASCPHCQRTIPLWNAAYQRRPKNTDVVGVMLDREFPGFFSVMPVSFTVVRAPDREIMKAFKVSSVPVTLRVAPGGKVQDVQVGPTDAMRLGQLFGP
jgi:thiol-disulfide isomerase/thioredoxin